MKAKTENKRWAKGLLKPCFFDDFSIKDLPSFFSHPTCHREDTPAYVIVFCKRKKNSEQNAMEHYCVAYCIHFYV